MKAAGWRWLAVLVVGAAACRTVGVGGGPLVIIEAVLDAGTQLDVQWADGGHLVVTPSEFAAPVCDAAENPPVPLPVGAADGGPFGTVVIKCLVLPTGRMRGCRVLQGVGGEADTLAAGAVGTWRCRPATVQGRPVAAAHLTTIDFGAPPAPTAGPAAVVVLAPAASLPALPSSMPPPRVPASNALTAEKAELGAALFLEPSVGGAEACSGCHQPSNAFTRAAPVKLPLAGAPAQLNVPSLVNVAWQSSWGLEGQFTSLEEQLGAHAQAVGADWKGAAAKLGEAPRWRALFARAFAGAAASPENLAQALASYLRTIASGPGPYEKSVAGDKAALSAEAAAGRTLFDSLGCARCHRPPRYLDPDRHSLAEGPGKLRTPGLRNVAQSGPWLHDGSAATLSDALTAHARHPAGKDDPNGKPIKLKPPQLARLKAFLEALSGPVSSMPAPAGP